MISLNEALGRADQVWSRAVTHTEAETAFQDRTILAAEIYRLREELDATTDALREADTEIDHMTKWADGLP